MDINAIFENWKRAVTDHYFDMSGRVGRRQFWYFVLTDIAMGFVILVVQSLTFLPLVALFNLAMILPTAGMCARRLQDTGRDGKLVWLLIIAAFVSQIITVLAMIGATALGFLGFLFFGPIAVLINLAVLVGSLLLIYFCGQAGDPNSNAYGPPPPVFDPYKRVTTPL